MFQIRWDWETFKKDYLIYVGMGMALFYVVRFGWFLLGKFVQPKLVEAGKAGQVGQPGQPGQVGQAQNPAEPSNPVPEADTQPLEESGESKKTN